MFSRPFERHSHERLAHVAAAHVTTNQVRCLGPHFQPVRVDQRDFVASVGVASVIRRLRDPERVTILSISAVRACIGPEASNPARGPTCRRIDVLKPGIGTGTGAGRKCPEPLRYALRS